MSSSFTSSSSASGSALAVTGLGRTYALLAFAMLLTALGAAAGATLALPIVASGWVFFLLIAELAIVWTAPGWSRSSPLNLVLFALFPFLSGLTIAPFLLSVGLAYVNGAAILLNASIATVLLCLVSALVASRAQGNLAAQYGWIVFQALIGLILFGILQIFFPSLRGSGAEMLVSAVGIVVFVIFLAIDIQRLQRRGAAESPFLLALSLYLDVFNLFLYVVRFMLAFGGERRR